MLIKKISCGALLIIGGLALAAHAAKGTTGKNMTDTSISSTIRSLYAETADLKSLNISVTTNKQHVMLAGKVQTNSQYEKSILLAESVVGVKDVNADHLKVNSSEAPLTDTLITAKVKGRFLREKLFGDNEIEYWPVKVETKNGTVYLTGQVSTETQRSHLIELAESVKGVKQVNSALRLS